jgi:hypothetical protein
MFGRGLIPADQKIDLNGPHARKSDPDLGMGMRCTRGRAEIMVFAFSRLTVKREPGGWTCETARSTRLIR